MEVETDFFSVLGCIRVKRHGSVVDRILRLCKAVLNVSLLSIVRKGQGLNDWISLICHKRDVCRKTELPYF